MLESFLNFPFELNTPIGWSKLQAFEVLVMILQLNACVFLWLASNKKIDEEVPDAETTFKSFAFIYFLLIVVIPFAVIAYLKPTPVDADTMSFFRKVLYYTNADTTEWWRGWAMVVFICALGNLSSGYWIWIMGDDAPKFLKKFPFNVLWPRKLITFALLVLCYDGLLYCSKWVLSYLGLPWHPMG